MSPTLTFAVDGWNVSDPFAPTMMVIATPASPQLSLPPLELLLELELELELLLPPELLLDELLLEEVLPPLLELLPELLLEPLPLELPPSFDPELLPPPSVVPFPPLLPLLQPASDEAYPVKPRPKRSTNERARIFMRTSGYHSWLVRKADRPARAPARAPLPGRAARRCVVAASSAVPRAAPS